MSISLAGAPARLQCLPRISYCLESVQRSGLSQCRALSSPGIASRLVEGAGSESNPAHQSKYVGEQHQGRYSRKAALRPEHVISRLQQPSRQRPPREHRAREFTPPPPEVLKKISLFVFSYEKQEQDIVLWRQLEEIRKALGNNKAQINFVSKREGFQEALGQFALRCCARWVQSVFENPVSEDPAVRPTDAIALFWELHNGPGSVLSDSIWILASHILERQAVPPATASGHQPAVDKSLHELVLLWNMLLKNTSTTPSSDSLDWSFLPRHDAFTQTLSAKKPHERTYEAVVAMLMRTLPQRDVGHPLNPAVSSLITNHLLQKPVISADGASATSAANNPKYAPFAQLLETLRQECGTPTLPVAIVEKLGEPFSDQVQKQYKIVIARYGVQPPEVANRNSREPSHDPYATFLAWGAGSETLRSVFGNVPIEGLPAHERIEADDTVSGLFIKHCMKRLSRAMRTGDAEIAIGVKDEVLRVPERRSDIKLTSQVYETLMLTLMLLKVPEHIPAVWAAFVGSGHAPTVKTFTLLMTGARHMRNTEALERTWESMIKYEIQPDASAWSTRIFGLIRGGRVDDGMAALRDMSQAWLQSRNAKSQTSKAPAPAALTTVVMNSVLSALAASRKADQLIPKVLAWGRQLGLEPDTETFNVMLATSARSGQADETIEIMEQMQQRGLQANSTTWTVVVTDMFSKGWLEELSPEEIHDQVKALLNNLEVIGGAGLDSKGYATLLNSLLKQYNHTAAAQTVLAHMHRKGIAPSPHIYTILLTAYFDAQPLPDFESLNKMWQHIATQNRGYGARLDDYFWDRAVEGYARYHRTVGLRACFDRLREMRRAGHMPSWPSLGLVAGAAAERKDMARLAQLVDDVRQWERENSIKNVWHKSSAFGRHDFWKTIVDTGILRAEGIHDVSQIPPRPRAGDAKSALQEE